MIALRWNAPAKRGSAGKSGATQRARPGTIEGAMTSAARLLACLAVTHAALLGCSPKSTAAPAAADTGVGSGGGSVPTAPSGDAGANPASTVAFPDPSASCTAGVDTSGFWGLEAKGLGDDRTAKLCQYAGKVVLVVNVASSCGYTPQYTGLQAVYAKYAAQGFVVLGFPCNQFGSQESGSAETIRDFCSSTYKVTFPLFEKVDVNGANTHPVYQWLKAQPGATGDVAWNFTKFLVGRDGKLVKRWGSQVEPEDARITAEIEAALAK
jgi:glutathione peroxidase